MKIFLTYQPIMSNKFANLDSASHDIEKRQAYVTEMFDALAPRYDRFNRWVSFKQDEAWRRQAIHLLGNRASGLVLDLAAGTGDLANAAILAGAEQVHVFDISHEMLKIAKKKLIGLDESVVGFEQGSANNLPFRDQSIDGIVSGFAMRNVFHFLDDVLAELHRVLKPGGKFAILELSRPQNKILNFGFKLHMQMVMPVIGRLATGSASPFGYLCKTTMTFLTPQAFCERLQKAGFIEVGWQSFLFGGIAIHHGKKACE